MKTKLKLIFPVGLCLGGWAMAQDTIVSAQATQQLDEVVVSSGRIELPFSQTSRTVTLITADQIAQSGITNVADLLQQQAGVDIRRRGVDGSQADLYIRGGSFDQTLLLIDGVKLEDPQSGHHTLNLSLPVETIERIEVIKGPAARVYGQNAFTGAVNIVTKNPTDQWVHVGLDAGSFDQKKASVTMASQLEGSAHMVNYTRNTSEGYRHNTDYDNQAYFLKSRFGKGASPLEVMAVLADRKFGANGFYATPSATEQYEETQASLVALSTRWEKGRFAIKPRLYWRRNQDMYLYNRNVPTGYRNMTIGNKVGAETNVAYTSGLGVTGFGLDLSEVFLASNNLGDHRRFMGNFFLEHRFAFLDDKLDVTPGVAVNYLSDFGFHAFPGIDLGYKLSPAVRVYGNMGYTYRIPTYTDLYYESPSERGNADLSPEDAISEEVGLKYGKAGILAHVAFFNRSAHKLIDYVKQVEEDPWMASNVRDTDTRGVEAGFDYLFPGKDRSQRIHLGYTYIDDTVRDLDEGLSRYSLNSLKHEMVVAYTSRIAGSLVGHVSYRYAERSLGASYSLLDAHLQWTWKQLEMSVNWNNILDEVYTETNLVPMPGSNVLFGLGYRLR